MGYDGTDLHCWGSSSQQPSRQPSDMAKLSNSAKPDFPMPQASMWSNIDDLWLNQTCWCSELSLLSHSWPSSLAFSLVSILFLLLFQFSSSSSSSFFFFVSILLLLRLSSSSRSFFFFSFLLRLDLLSSSSLSLFFFGFLIRLYPSSSSSFFFFVFWFLLSYSFSSSSAFLVFNLRDSTCWQDKQVKHANGKFSFFVVLVVVVVVCCCCLIEMGFFPLPFFLFSFFFLSFFTLFVGPKLVFGSVPE